jgi:hypothetical protein
VRSVVLALAVACSGGRSATGPTEPTPPPDPRPTIEKRRDTACDQLQPTLTECAIADAKASLSPAEYAKLKPEELRGKHKQQFLKECKGSQMSSRQVRVLEVCFREEKQCGPLAECLANLKPQPQQ